MFLNTSSALGTLSAGAWPVTITMLNVQIAAVVATAAVTARLALTCILRSCVLRPLPTAHCPLKIKLRPNPELTPVENLRDVFPRRPIRGVHRQHGCRVEQIVDVEARADPPRAPEAERPRKPEIELLRARLER